MVSICNTLVLQISITATISNSLHAIIWWEINIVL